jgi:hypothetical protein
MDVHLFLLWARQLLRRSRKENTIQSIFLRDTCLHPDIAESGIQASLEVISLRLSAALFP